MLCALCDRPAEPGFRYCSAECVKRRRQIDRDAGKVTYRALSVLEAAAAGDMDPRAAIDEAATLLRQALFGRRAGRRHRRT